MTTLQETVRRVLDSFPDIEICILFCSASSGKATPDSDLDLAVAADRPLTAERRLELTQALSSVSNRSIDLIDLMADSGLVLRQALSKGVLVRNSNKNPYARIISRMLFDHADMSPYYNRILRERRMRFLNG